jgi:trimeric autotransporter adhesin
MGSSNITNVTVACTNAYTVEGTVSGLTGSGLLLNTGTFDYGTVSVSAVGSFTVPGSYTSGDVPRV